MSLVVPEASAIELLTRRKLEWDDLYVKLFKNNLTPGAATVLGDLTECDFAGYAAVLVSSWGTVSTVSGRASVTGSTCTFTRSSTGTAQNVYGYYVVSDGDLLWVERDPSGPFSVASAGDNYAVVPKFTEKSEF